MPIYDHIGEYTDKLPVGYAGMIAETSGPKDVASRTVESESIAFGLAVGAGTADRSCRLGGTGFEGIAISDKSRLADLYDIGESAGIMRKGSVWVVASTDVTSSDPVTFTAATGVIGAGLAVTAANAKFETTATAGDLVLVYLG